MDADALARQLPGLRYEVAGSGPDLLFVHGFASSRRNWEDVLPPLSRRWRCWAVDLYGFGETPAPPGVRLDLDLHVASLSAFCEAHAFRPHAVIGHSMGGLLTLKLALARPDQLSRLVLVCPVVTGRIGFHANRLIASAPGRYLLRRGERLWRLVQTGLLAPLLPAPFYLDTPRRRRVKADFRRATWAACAPALQAIAAENLSDRLAEITQPALVIVGARDLTVPPSEGRLAARLLPNARLVEFERSHHAPPDEETERFLVETERFLAADDESLIRVGNMVQLQ